MSDVTSKDFSWEALVREAEGESLYEKPVVYEFNNGERAFTESLDHVLEDPTA
jgi:hypothetical protein